MEWDTGKQTKPNQENILGFVAVVVVAVGRDAADVGTRL